MTYSSTTMAGYRTVHHDLCDIAITELVRELQYTEPFYIYDALADLALGGKHHIMGNYMMEAGFAMEAKNALMTHVRQDHDGHINHAYGALQHASRLFTMAQTTDLTSHEDLLTQMEYTQALQFINVYYHTHKKEID